MTEPKLIPAGQILTECCKKTIPGQNDDMLLHKLQALIPDYPVFLAHASEEWYKLGGVVDNAGRRIAGDLTEWVERSFIECGQNLQTLIEYALEQQYIATRVTGRTLSFVVQTGPQAEDFILIEIDKIHEVTDRMLVDREHPPEDLEEFIDPMQPFCIESAGLGHSKYIYKRKTDVGLFMQAVNEHYPTEHPAQRFMDDWNRSSAGQEHRMSRDWIIRPYRHIGRFGEQIVNVEIIDVHQGKLPHLEDFAGKKGPALSSILTRFDRQAGYPFAWFFYMLKGQSVSTHSAESVYLDLSNDFAYLPKRDEAVLRDWIAQPYNV